jgi:hypothetical protein
MFDLQGDPFHLSSDPFEYSTPLKRLDHLRAYESSLYKGQLRLIESRRVHTQGHSTKLLAGPIGTCHQQAKLVRQFFTGFHSISPITL